MLFRSFVSYYMPTTLKLLRTYNEVDPQADSSAVEMCIRDSISSLLDAPLFDDNGLLAAQSDGRWGFINDKGEWVVNPQFAWVGEFKEQGLCVVRNEEQYGYIGLDGKYIINPIFLDAESFSGNNLAAAQDKETEKWGIRSSIVGIPKGLLPPFDFGISTSFTALGI